MRPKDRAAHVCSQQACPCVSVRLLSALLLTALACVAAAAPDPPEHSSATFGTSPWQAQIESLAAVEDELRAPVASHADPPAICVIVRTFWGHGGQSSEHQQQGLRSLLASLRAQKNPRQGAVHPAHLNCELMHCTSVVIGAFRHGSSISGPWNFCKVCMLVDGRRSWW